MLPTFVNTIAILFGGAIGLLLHGRLASRFQTILFQTLGLITLMIGLRGALETQDIPLLALSMILGALIGEAIDIEGRLRDAGDGLRRLLRQQEDGQFVDGFVYASLLFCVGAMAVVGCFRAGVQGDGDILYTKSLLDGHAAIFLASVMGAGVMASAVSVLLFQGALTVLFMLFARGLPEPVVLEVSASGGLIITGIGLKLLDMGEIRVGNLLPAMLIAGALAGAKMMWMG